MPIDEQSFIITTLERINSKLDKHDDKIDMIVQAMQQLVKVDTENKEIKESLKRVFKRLEEVEDNQSNDGCPAHKADMKLSDEKRKGYEKIVKDNEEEHKDFDTRITLLEQKPMKAMDKFTMALIGALGVGFGGWILLKFGVQTK